MEKAMENMELKQAIKELSDEFNLTNIIYRISILEKKFKNLSKGNNNQMD